MAEPINIPVIFEEDVSGLSKSQEALAKLRKEQDAFVDTQKKNFEESAKVVEGYKDSLQDAGTEMADLAATTKDTSQTGGAFKAMIRENVRGLTLFGVNLGDAIDKLRSKKAALQGVVSGLGGASGALRVFKVALVSTGIGAIVVLLGSLIAFLTKTKAGTDKIAQAMAGFGAVVDLATKKLIGIGRGAIDAWESFKTGYPTIYRIVGVLGDVAKVAFEVASGIALLTKLFPGATEEFKQAALAAAQLEAQNQRLADSERDLAVEISARRAAIEKNKEIADDETKSFQTRIKAAKAAASEEQLLKKKEIELAEESLRIIREQNKLKVDADQDAEAQAIIRINDLKAEASKKERGDLNKTQALLRQQQREIRALSEEERKRNEQRLKIEQQQRQAFSDLQKSLAQQINDEEQLASNEQERLAFQRDNALEQLALAEQELIARARFLEQEEEIAKIQTDFARLRALTSERYEKEITKVTEEEIKKRNTALEQSTDEYLDKQNEIRQKRIQFVQQEQEIDELRIDLLKKSGNDELSLEQFKEDAKLRVLQNSLERQRQIILDTDTTGLGEQLFDVQKIDLQIAAIDDKLATLEALPIFDRIRNRFKSLFNLDDEQLAEIGNQLGNALDSVFDGFSSLYDAQIAQQRAVVDARREAVDALQQQLDEELRLKEQGVANNSDLLKKQLAEQTEILKKEEEKRLALEKKAAQLRLRQNALEIASNIALSVAKAIEANAKFGLVGVVTAAAQIASIFALIAKARAQAAQFEVPKLRQGAKLEGRSHEQGGVPILIDGVQAYEAEGGEWLVGSKPSREHDNFLERLNDNEFSGLDLNRHVDFSKDFFQDPEGMIHGLAPKYGIPIMPDVVADILPKIRETVLNGQVASRAMEKQMMAEVMSEMFGQVAGGMERVERAIMEQPQVIPITPDGYMVKSKKGNTTTVAVYDPPKRKGK